MKNKFEKLAELSHKKPNREKIVTFRVSWGEYDIIQENAAKFGLDVSSWLRYAALMYDPSDDLIDNDDQSWE